MDSVRSHDAEDKSGMDRFRANHPKFPMFYAQYHRMLGGRNDH